jgi:hypothetical protein
VVGEPDPLVGSVAADAAVCSVDPDAGGSVVVVAGAVAEVVLAAGRVVVDALPFGVAGTVAVVPFGRTVVRVDGREELVVRGVDEVPVLRGVLEVDEGLGLGDGFGAAAGGGELGAPPAPKANPITLPAGGSYSATPLLL